ncbi:unnamed protein product [Camellia sinensis]
MCVLNSKKSSSISKSLVSNPLYGFLKKKKKKKKNSNTRRMESSSNFVARASAQPLKNADQLIDSVETFIFDCDGVIWKGDKLIDGVPESLDMLRTKIWNLGSPDPNFTLDAHLKGVNCVDYFTGGDKPYLITGFDDHNAKP